MEEVARVEACQAGEAFTHLGLKVFLMLSLISGFPKPFEDIVKLYGIITIVLKIDIRIVKPRGKSIQCHQPSSHTAMWEEAFLGGHKHLPLKIK